MPTTSYSGRLCVLAQIADRIEEAAKRIDPLLGALPPKITFMPTDGAAEGTLDGLMLTYRDGYDGLFISIPEEIGAEAEFQVQLAYFDSIVHEWHTTANPIIDGQCGDVLLEAAVMPLYSRLLEEATRITEDALHPKGVDVVQPSFHILATGCSKADAHFCARVLLANKLTFCDLADAICAIRRVLAREEG